MGKTTHLTVLFDEDCGLCRRARSWLEGQKQSVSLRFVPAASDEARRRYPGLQADETLRELTVVGDGGAVYRGAKAWVVCLWALREYRSLALDLASPELMPVARRWVAWASKQRYHLSRILD